MATRMLTTVDNPFDPFTQFNEWYSWDLRAGYNTLALLGRIIFTSTDLTEVEQDDAFDAAMQEILDENVVGLYIAVPEGTTPRARLSA